MLCTAVYEVVKSAVFKYHHDDDDDDDHRVRAADTRSDLLGGHDHCTPSTHYRYIGHCTLLFVTSSERVTDRRTDGQTDRQTDGL